MAGLLKKLSTNTGIMSQSSTRQALIIRDRHFDIHIYNLAAVLIGCGYQVTILYTKVNEIDSCYQELIDEARLLGAHILIVRDRTVEDCLCAMAGRFLYRVNIGPKSLIVTPGQVREAKRSLKDQEFDFVFPVGNVSLFLACQLFQRRLRNLIYYSLEILTEDNKLFKHPTERNFANYERSVLPKLGGLIIQDRFREKLFRESVGSVNKTVIYFPVSVAGPPIKKAQRNSIYDVYSDNTLFRVLFFGALYDRELIGQLRNVSKIIADDEVIILHGGKSSLRVQEEISEKFVIVRNRIPYRSIDAVLATSHIGLALYSQNLNQKYTAFASEKIARYTKVGLPFIAFRNEDYEFLRLKTGSCVLIDDYSELPEAISIIRRDYDRFRVNAFRAFESIYDLKAASGALLRHVNGKVSRHPNLTPGGGARHD